MITVKLPDGTEYTVKTLLGDGDSNTKLSKSDQSDSGYITYGLSLAPANVSGYNVCASSSPGCRAACLFTSGHGRMQPVQRARIAKTIAFFEHKGMFDAMIRDEIEAALRKANKKNKRLAIRLNVLSDIMWENFKIVKDYPMIQFYDYTKHFKRMLKYCQGKLPKNYHLTFSRSECNEKETLEVLKAGGNVTVVFNSKDLPKKWNEYEVINGDETDLRFLDKKNCVVGLYMKGDGKKDKSGFVVSLPLA
jgi:hypothetical protein